jgi:hypothetical protein
LRPAPPPEPLAVSLTVAVERARALGPAERVGWFLAPAHGLDPARLVVPAEHEAAYLASLEGGWFGYGPLAEVEFWPRGLDGALLAPRSNWFTRRVPAAEPRVPTVVEGVEAATLPLLAGPPADAGRLAIDVVYTWVDGADPAWRARRDARLRAADPGAAAEARSGEARYRDHDELRYSMRSIAAYAPWVRTIHLVTDGQRPAWLGDHPRVHLVDHTEILGPDVLPTFNSQAIETAVHRIPGLAEHFVYLNDDMLLGRPVAPDLFFSPGGLPAVLLSDLTLDVDGSDDRPYALAAFNNRRLLAERFGATILRTIRHAPYAHRRSTLEAVEHDFPAAVAGTAAAPFRSPSDVSMLSSLAQHYGLLAGLAYPADARDEFVDLSEAFVEKRLAALASAGHDFLCLGDHHRYALPEERVEALLREYLEAAYPVAGPWER